MIKFSCSYDRGIYVGGDRRNVREGVLVDGGNVFASRCDGWMFRLICGAFVDIRGDGQTLRRRWWECIVILAEMGKTAGECRCWQRMVR